MKNRRIPRGLCHLILCLLLVLGAPAGTLAVEPSDISGHWAEGALLHGMELGWIEGYEDGTFRPDAPMTRSEYTILLSRLLGLEEVSSQTMTRFSDRAANTWDDGYLARAEAAGLFDVAYPGNLLSPSTPITREEAAQLLLHSLRLKETKDSRGNLNPDILATTSQFLVNQSSFCSDVNQLSFTDRHQVSPRFVFAIDELNHIGIFTGYEDNSFSPQSQLTRAEATTLLLRATGEAPKIVEPPKEKPAPTEPTPPPSVPNPTLPKASKDNLRLVQDGKDFFLEDAQTHVRLLGSDVSDGVVKVGEKTYLLDKDGRLKSDFYKKDNKVYYIDKEKGMISGWKQIGDHLYYFSPANQRMYRNGMFSTGEGVYWFGSDGKLKTGSRAGGHSKRRVNWAGPTAKELENHWLEGEDRDLRFRGQEIANYAASFEGLPFKWYGVDLTDGTGVCCVGNSYSAYKAFGIRIPGPADCQVKKHKGYELTRCQYEYAPKFGGMRYRANFDNAWPGDLIFNYSPGFYLGYNHVGIYMGKNDGRPIYVHATLKDGLFVGDTREMNWTIGRRFNKEFVRYNTRQNVGSGKIPDMPRNR